jgi:DNA-binding transcriptional ArsR family regulator
LVKYADQRLDAVYSAVSHTARRRIIERLRAGEATVSELAEPFAMSLPAVSKHIRVLESAGVVRRSVDGREHRISLQAAALEPAAGWLETYRAFWESRLDLLEASLRTRQGR